MNHYKNPQLLDHNNNNKNNNDDDDGKPVDRLINDATELLKFAYNHRYHVLYERCVYILIKYLTPKNVWKIFNVAVTTTQNSHHQHFNRFTSQLINSCEQQILNLIEDAGYNLLLNENDAIYAMLSAATVCKLIEMSRIGFSEYEKFQFILKWTRFTYGGGGGGSDIRQLLLALLEQRIVWYRMTSEELNAVTVEVPNLLANEKIVAALRLKPTERRRRIGKRKGRKSKSTEKELTASSSTRLNNVIQRYVDSMDAGQQMTDVVYAEFDSTDSWTWYRPMLADQERFDFYDHDTVWAVSYYRVIEWITIVLFVVGTSYELFFQCFY